MGILGHLVGSAGRPVWMVIADALSYIVISDGHEPWVHEVMRTFGYQIV